MLFVAAFFVALPTWAVVIVLWWGCSLMGLVAPPTPEQTAGIGWLLMGSSQICALGLVGFLVLKG